MGSSSIMNTCFYCKAQWGKCKCTEGDEVLFVSWSGTNITNPGVSECGRFYVNPLHHYGTKFTEWLSYCVHSGNKHKFAQPFIERRFL